MKPGPSPAMKAGMFHRRLPLLLLSLALGCEGASEGPLDAGRPNVTSDAGVERDAGEARDAGERQDASARDAAEEPEAGPQPDAGEAQDAGGADAGMALDAGEALDAGMVDAGQPALDDPEQPGPYMVASHAETYRVPASGNDLPLDCRYPSAGPTGGPFPAVLIGHGFQIAASQYLGYAERLASLGFVACTADFRAGFVANHAENATDLIGGVDWLVAIAADAAHPLGPYVDPTRVGVMGHSLGGKVSFLAAARDSRIGAVLGVDPVDAAPFCNSTRCPDASSTLPFVIPVGLLGETLDAAGGLQPCAPAADNFRTFYDASATPTVEVEVLGASHVSFVDDPSTCGLACSACNAPTLDHAEVLRVSRAVTAAFFLRHLAGDLAYDAYLTGASAQARYVQTGMASIRSK